MTFTFGIHVQAVGFAVIACSQVPVTNGDVKCVTACDVVTQRFPVHCDLPGPGLNNLQPLWSPHWFCKVKAKVNGMEQGVEEKSHKSQGGGEFQR